MRECKTNNLSTSEKSDINEKIKQITLSFLESVKKFKDYIMQKFTIFVYNIYPWIILKFKSGKPKLIELDFNTC